MLNGWVEYADFVSSVPIASLSAKFVVPELPTWQGTTPDGNYPVVSYFPGLQPAPDTQNTTILQPVVGYDLTPGNRGWTIVGADCCDLSNWASENIAVSPGDELLFTVEGSKCNAEGVCGSWKVAVQDETIGKGTTFTTKQETKAFTWVFGGVIEAYGVTRCDQFPAPGSVRFTDIVVKDVNGKVVDTPFKGHTLSWNSNPACGYAQDTSSSAVTLTAVP
jgi:hypothetical protein